MSEQVAEGVKQNRLAGEIGLKAKLVAGTATDLDIILLAELLELKTGKTVDECLNGLLEQIDAKIDFERGISNFLAKKW